MFVTSESYSCPSRDPKFTSMIEKIYKKSVNVELETFNGECNACSGAENTASISKTMRPVLLCIVGEVVDPVNISFKEAGEHVEVKAH